MCVCVCVCCKKRWILELCASSKSMKIQLFEQNYNHMNESEYDMRVKLKCDNKK